MSQVSFPELSAVGINGTGSGDVSPEQAGAFSGLVESFGGNGDLSDLSENSGSGSESEFGDADSLKSEVKRLVADVKKGDYSAADESMGFGPASDMDPISPP